MAKEVIMPKFGFTQETAEIVRWLVQPGQVVEQGDPIAEVTTDKVNMEVEAPVSGILDDVRYGPGDIVPVTHVIAVIRAPNETLAPTSPAEPASSAPAAPAPSETQPARTLSDAPRLTPVASKLAQAAGMDVRGLQGTGVGGRVTREDVQRAMAAGGAGQTEGKVRAVPAARRLATELDVDLTGVTGSGPRGRVQSVDVQQAAQARPAQAPTPQPVAPEPALQPLAAATGLRVVTTIPLIGMRRTIATRLQKSYQDIPHITFDADIDVTAAEALRVLANQRVREGQPKVSLTAIIAKTCAWALKRHPMINSQLAETGIQLIGDINIGIAVALEDGLIVPVVRAVDQKGIVEIASEIADLSTRARAGQLRPEDVQDGTFTISNLGMFGVDRFTAIINPPQTAILAVSRVARRFVPDENDQAVVRPLMTVTLAADHRVIDGAVAARFLGEVRAGLEQPELLSL